MKWQRSGGTPNPLFILFLVPKLSLGMPSRFAPQSKKRFDTQNLDGKKNLQGFQNLEGFMTVKKSSRFPKP